MSWTIFSLIVETNKSHQNVDAERRRNLKSQPQSKHQYGSNSDKLIEPKTSHATVYKDLVRIGRYILFLPYETIQLEEVSDDEQDQASQ